MQRQQRQGHVPYSTVRCPRASLLALLKLLLLPPTAAAALPKTCRPTRQLHAEVQQCSANGPRVRGHGYLACLATGMARVVLPRDQETIDETYSLSKMLNLEDWYLDQLICLIYLTLVQGGYSQPI